MRVYSSDENASNLNFTASFKSPCTVDERITISVRRNTSAQPSEGSGFVSTHPTGPDTHFTAPLRLDLKLLSIKSSRNKKAKIYLKVNCLNGNLRDQIKILKSPSRNPIFQLPIFLQRGQFKTVSFLVPLYPQEIRYKATVYDQTQKPVKEILITVPAHRPSFFIIAGFRFDVDYQKGEAYCRLPFSLDYSITSIGGERIGGVDISPSGGVSPVSGGGTGGFSGTTIKVNFRDIGFDNFQLDQNNRVTRGSFEVSINRFLLLSNARKAVFLKKISFSPSRAKAWFTLNLGDKFTPSVIEFSPSEVTPDLSHGLVLRMSSPLQLRSSYDNRVSLTLTQILIHLNQRKITRSKLRSSIDFGDGTILNGEGRISFSPSQEGAGIFLSCKKPESSGDTLHQLWQSIQPFWEKVIDENFSMVADEVLLDWDPYFTPSYFRSSPDWTGSILKGVSLRVFVPLMTQTLPNLDFPSVRDAVPYYYKSEVSSYKFSLKQDNFLILAIPKGLRLILKQGSSFVLRGTQISSYLNAEVELPEEFESSSGNKIRAPLGNIPASFSITDRRITFNDTFSLKRNKKFEFKSVVGRLTLTPGEGVFYLRKV